MGYSEVLTERSQSAARVPWEGCSQLRVLDGTHALSLRPKM